MFDLVRTVAGLGRLLRVSGRRVKACSGKVLALVCGRAMEPGHLETLAAFLSMSGSAVVRCETGVLFGSWNSWSSHKQLPLPIVTRIFYIPKLFRPSTSDLSSLESGHCLLFLISNPLRNAARLRIALISVGSGQELPSLHCRPRCVLSCRRQFCA